MVCDEVLAFVGHSLLSLLAVSLVIASAAPAKTTLALELGEEGPLTEY
jgi:hypothetical protein